VSARNIILVIALLFIAAFGYATLRDAADNGIGVLNVLAVLVLALFCFGIVGALLHPPDV
jgi:predicted ABC-type exoprotein transport system permease subunit